MAYIFAPDVIHAAGLTGVGLPVPQCFAAVLDALDQRYPNCIDRTQPWLFNNAGGAMIEMKLLYCSNTEYVMLFGTPVGTGGHSGRHLAEFHDTILDGETWYFSAGELERTVYKAGDRIFMGKGESIGFNVPDHAWGLEYARGAMPLLLPFGMADSLFSTLDFKTVARTLLSYSELTLKSLRRPTI